MRAQVIVLAGAAGAGKSRLAGRGPGCEPVTGDEGCARVCALTSSLRSA